MKKSVIATLILIIITLTITSTINAADFEKGHMKLLAAAETVSGYKGSTADLYLSIESGEGRVFIESFPLTKLDTQISTRFAKEIACDYVGAECDKYDFFYTIRADSSIVGGPSAGSAMAVLTASVLEDLAVDQSMSISGTINSGNLIGPVGSLKQKIDAAKKAGLETVLIPEGERFMTEDNETQDLVEYGEEIGIKVIEVSRLGEALSLFTGKNLSKQMKQLEVEPSYLETMKILAERLCERGLSMNKSITHHFNQSQILEDAYNYTQKGEETIEEGLYYTAASFCLTANVRYRYLWYLNQNYSNDEVAQMITMIQLKIKDFNDGLPKYETLTDLQSYVMVKERLVEARELLNKSQDYLEKGIVEDSLYNLAYANERLYSAESWSVFFGKPGKEFEISRSINESCLRKISEAEERYQYVRLLFPLAILKIRKQINQAYDYLDQEHYELCLFKASEAKAEANIVLSVYGVSDEHIKDIVHKKLVVAKENIVRETEKGIFPIVGYSYYEYANSLKQTDPYSALLYAEYALELSNLELYFKTKTKTKRFELRKEWIIFVLGAVFGSSLTLLILLSKLSKKPKVGIKTKKKRLSRKPARTKPRRKRKS